MVSYSDLPKTRVLWEKKKEQENMSYIEQQRLKHSKAYVQWTKEEDQKLIELYSKGETIEELVGKTAVAIVNLPPRKMMGIDSEGMLISAVHEEDGHEGLNLLMLDNKIPAGAKLY